MLYDPRSSGIGDGHFWARHYPVYPPVSWSVSAAVCPSVALGVVGSLLTNSPGLTSQYTIEIFVMAHLIKYLKCNIQIAMH